MGRDGWVILEKKLGTLIVTFSMNRTFHYPHPLLFLLYNTTRKCFFLGKISSKPETDAGLFSEWFNPAGVRLRLKRIQ